MNMKKIRTRPKQTGNWSISLTKFESGGKQLSVKLNGIERFKIHVGRIVPKIYIDYPVAIKRIVKTSVLLILWPLADWLYKLIAQ